MREAEEIERRADDTRVMELLAEALERLKVVEIEAAEEKERAREERRQSEETAEDRIAGIEEAAGIMAARYEDETRRLEEEASKKLKAMELKLEAAAHHAKEQQRQIQV